MKTIFRVLLALSLFTTPLPQVAAAIYPETNALAFSTNIAPLSPMENGIFGRHSSFKSNVAVFGHWIEPASTNNILASVFRLNGQTLDPETALPAPAITNLAVYDLATDGQRIVFAASENNEPALYIFQRVRGAWLHETTLRPAVPLWSISIFNGTVAAGAPGKVLIYEQIGNAWNDTTIVAPTNSFSGAFGADVAIDHDTLLVGSPGDSRGRPGGAYVYVRTDQGWQLQTELPGEQFVFTPIGRSVALEGDFALVSAYPDRFNSGFVYVYQRSADAWKLLGYVTGDGGGDFFGQSVAISGRNLVVGAPSARGGGGVVFLFRHNGTSFDQFRLFRDEFEPGAPGAAGSFLGNAVAIDQNTIVATAPYHDAYGFNAGGGAIFKLQFNPWLHSPFARFSDSSFHFTVSDATIGDTYVLQTSIGLDPPTWSTVKEFQAQTSEVQLQVDLSTTKPSFFRLIKQAADSQPTNH